MQNPFIPFVLLLFMQGVFGADETVTEGGSVTLHTGVTEIQNDDVIEWNFGPQNMFLCQITRQGDLTPISLTHDVGFSGRLQVDHKTGSLTIRNTRIRHSGQYKVTISSEETTTKMFKVTVQSVVGESGGVKSVSVLEGGSITLQNDVKIQRDDLTVWRFGDKGVLLAKFDAETNKASLNGSDESFRDRLKLDHQTGSLTITNTRTTDSGLYELQTTGRESSQQFLLSVKDPGWSSLAIAGIVFVVVLLLAAAAAACFWYNRRNLGEEINVSQNEGEDVLLHTGLTKLSEDRTIQWWYGAELISIAKISGKNPETHDVPDGRFGNRLTLNENTGDLTIKNIKTIHSGLYKLKISSNTCTGRITRYQCKRFILTVNINELKTNEGNNLEIRIKGEQRNHDMILWKFGPEGRLIAKFDVSTKKTYKEVFKNSHESNLKLDDQTGSLTITNITTEHAGLYKLQICSISGTKNRKYSVTCL